MKIYCASKTSHAPMWQRLRSEGIPLISTWIDEAGAGQTDDLGELWGRIHREVVTADRVVLYAEMLDFPLKGALIEAGMALAAGVPVGLVLASDVRLEVPSCRPIGSWINHPGVTRCETLGDAFNDPLRGMSVIQ
jgi:hypothetical protein